MMTRFNYIRNLTKIKLYLKTKNKIHEKDKILSRRIEKRYYILEMKHSQRGHTVQIKMNTTESQRGLVNSVHIPLSFMSFTAFDRWCIFQHSKNYYFAKRIKFISFHTQYIDGLI